MRLFLESADVTEVRACIQQRIINGVLTTADRIDRAGRDPIEVVAEICRAVVGPVTVEPRGADVDELVAQARRFAALAPNVVVALPFSDAMLAGIRGCADDGIRTLVTGCVHAGQAVLAARAGAGSVNPAVKAGGQDEGILSPGQNVGGDLIRRIVATYRSYGFATEVWVGPVASGDAAVDAALAGAHAVALPHALLRQLVKRRPADSGPPAS